MQNENTQRTQTADAVRIIINSLRLLRRTWWIVLLAVVVGAGFSGAKTWYHYAPTYQTRAVYTVRADNGKLGNVSYDSSQLSTNTINQVINTFEAIFETDAMHDALLEELGTGYINGTITPTFISSSNLFVITVTSSSAADAYAVLEAVLTRYPQVAAPIVGAIRLEMIEEPAMPKAPISQLNLVRPSVKGGIVLGLVVLALICLLAQVQKTVESVEDMKKITSMSCLAALPHIERKRRSRKKPQIGLLGSTAPAPFRETIRVLRTRVLRKLQDKQPACLLITSTAPGEGKSTIAANLAMSLSDAGLRVILVDADLRTQQLKDTFRITEQTKGLGDLLRSGEGNVTDCLISVPDSDLKLLCGNKIDHPQSLLRRRQIAALMEQLKQEADIVILDTPPIGLLSDAALFSVCADAAIYVVSVDGSTSGAIADGLRVIADTHTELLGYVINGVTTVSSRAGAYKNGYGYKYGGRYGYGSHYGYGYKYGYGSYDSYGSYGKEKKHRRSKHKDEEKQ